MSELNPYAKYLGGQPIKAILASTPTEISRLIAAIGPEMAAVSPAPGKWSPAEIICHLADCELAFGFRLRQTLAEDNHVIQPFDQEKWAMTYRGIGAEEALAAYSALRNWNLTFIGKAPLRAATKQVTHPERGTMTFETIVETMAGHDLNHLSQLQKWASATD